MSARRGSDVVEARLPTTQIMGLRLHVLTEAQTVAHVVEQAGRGRGGHVITPNLELLRRYVTDPAVRRHFDAADVVVADGMPVIWASALAGRPLPERVAGSDLIWSMPAAAAEAGLPIFLLGGTPTSVRTAAERLTERDERLAVSGVHSPPFGFERDPELLAEIERRLVDARPAIVFLGLAFPKQEELIERLRPALPHTWFVGAGMSINFVAGDVRRAPSLLQRTGLEWVHRLAQEPRRLFRRYVVDGLPFAARLGWWSLGCRLGRTSR